MINTSYSTPALRSTSQAAAPAAQAPAPEGDRVEPLDVYPMENDSLVAGGGWAGINKPVKVTGSDGHTYVAKSNTLGAFAGLHPDQNARKENIHEIVASHIVADEFKMPSLTFQEGFLVAPDGTKTEKVLSPLRTDFKTLEHASVKAIKDGDAAVGLTILQGFLGDWDSTYNGSNLWVRNDGVAMGADYGYAMNSGMEAVGVPFANIKIMKEFGTEQNISAITDKLKNLSDEDIHGMVQRTGSKWIHDWTPEMEKDMAGALIENRDTLRDHNPFMKHVEGLHLGLRNPLLKMKYPRFFWKASKAIAPSWKRPDQWLDVLGAVATYAKANRLASVLHTVRAHVHSPEEKAAMKKD